MDSQPEEETCGRDEWVLVVMSRLFRIEIEWKDDGRGLKQRIKMPSETQNKNV